MHTHILAHNTVYPVIFVEQNNDFRTFCGLIIAHVESHMCNSCYINLCRSNFGTFCMCAQIKSSPKQLVIRYSFTHTCNTHIIVHYCIHVHVQSTCSTPYHKEVDCWRKEGCLKMVDSPLPAKKGSWPMVDWKQGY